MATQEQISVRWYSANRVYLPNDRLVEELCHLCNKCKFDWFHSDYYKKKRKTINYNDIIEIYYACTDLKLKISPKLQEWFGHLTGVLILKKVKNGRISNHYISKLYSR